MANWPNKVLKSTEIWYCVWPLSKAQGQLWHYQWIPQIFVMLPPNTKKEYMFSSCPSVQSKMAAWGLCLYETYMGLLLCTGLRYWLNFFSWSDHQKDLGTEVYLKLPVMTEYVPKQPTLVNNSVLDWDINFILYCFWSFKKFQTTTTNISW